MGQSKFLFTLLTSRITSVPTRFGRDLPQQADKHLLLQHLNLLTLLKQSVSLNKSVTLRRIVACRIKSFVRVGLGIVQYILYLAIKEKNKKI